MLIFSIQVLLNLPNDFLRLPSTSAPNQIPMAALDPAAAQFYTFVPPNTRGRLVVKVVEGQLSKNYGLLRMDPYLRLRIGFVFHNIRCILIG